MAKKDLEPEAKRLYLLGRPIDEIARTLGVAPKTIWEWRKKYSWEQQMEKHKAQTEQETQEMFQKFRKGVVTAFGKTFMDTWKIYQTKIEAGGENIKLDDLIKMGKIIEEITRPPANPIVLGNNAQEVLSEKDILEAAIEGKSKTETTNDANRDTKTGDNVPVPNEERKSDS